MNYFRKLVTFLLHLEDIIAIWDKVLIVHNNSCNACPEFHLVLGFVRE